MFPVTKNEKSKCQQYYNTLCFKLGVILPVAFVLILSSCNQEQKQRKTLVKSRKIKVQVETRVDDSVRDSVALFTLTLTETGRGDTSVFVSISDIDVLPGNVNSPPDSVDRLVIPDQEGKPALKTRYITLKSKYRRRLLTATHISEKDSLFVYDNANNVLLKFAVNTLKTVANLSSYEDYMNPIHSAGDYMLGFEINRSVQKALSDKYFSDALVYIGASNPFTSGQMHPMIWKRTDLAHFPPVKLSASEQKILQGYKLTGSYKFELEDFDYYLQRFMSSNDTSSLRLIVLGPDKKMVFNRLYYQGESSTPSSINVAGESNNDMQWAGRLFKNRPPLILGFESLEFGCPIFPFMNKRHDEVILNCDNRH